MNAIKSMVLRSYDSPHAPGATRTHLSVREAAEAIGVPYSTLNYWLSKVPIPMVPDTDGKRFIDPDGLAMLRQVKALRISTGRGLGGIGRLVMQEFPMDRDDRRGLDLPHPLMDPNRMRPPASPVRAIITTVAPVAFRCAQSAAALGTKIVKALVPRSAPCFFGCSSVRSFSVLLFLLAISIALSLPTAMSSNCGAHSRTSSVKANMHALQLGVEQYAADHYGMYPVSLRASDFDWSTYVPSNPRNPYDYDVTGIRMLDESIGVEGTSVHTLAATDKRLFRAPGSVRYYVSHDRAQYALTGAGKGKVPLPEAHDSAGRPNYVLHN